MIKKLSSIVFLLLLIFATSPIQADQEQEVVKKANIMGMMYDWQYGQVNASGQFQWNGDTTPNTAFSWRNETFDLNWLMNSQKYKNLTPKLVRFAPVERVNDDEFKIKYFDIEDAMSRNPKENYWFYSDLIENNVERFFSKYYYKRYIPVEYTNVSLAKNGKITYQYKGKYNVEELWNNQPSYLDLVQEALKKQSDQSVLQGNNVLLAFWEQVGDQANFKANYPNEYNRLIRDFKNKTFDPSKVKFYLKFQPHVANIEFREENDLAVTEIQSGDFPTCEQITLYAKVANLGKSQKTSEVAFFYNQTKIGSKVVTLLPGETKTLTFNPSLPCTKGSATVTAWINPEKKIVEINYNNNKKTGNINLIDTTPKTVPNCVKTFTWTEKQQHTRCSGRGRNRTCWTYYTYHTYKATLETTYTVKDDRSALKKTDFLLNQNGTPHNFIRAGYGFQLSGNTKITVQQISGDPRAYTATITQPNKVDVTLNWDMKNSRNLKTKQAKTTVLELYNGNFVLPMDSEKKRVLYTNVNLKDGNHSMILDAQGGAVKANGKTQVLCGKENIEIKIKGDMYDDMRAR